MCDFSTAVTAAISEHSTFMLCFLAACNGKFVPQPNHKHPGGDKVDYATSTKECKAACMETPEYCAAIDMVNGKCFVHYKGVYKRGSVITQSNSFHYYVVPC